MTVRELLEKVYKSGVDLDSEVTVENLSRDLERFSRVYIELVDACEESENLSLKIEVETM